MFDADLQSRISIARDSLNSSLKMLSRIDDGAPIPAHEMPRILDAAVQASQAVAQLNQVAGLLQAELTLAQRNR